MASVTVFGGTGFLGRLAAIDDDVVDIDANAKRDLLLRLDLAIARGDAVLVFDGAAQRVHDARELR